MDNWDKIIHGCKNNNRRSQEKMYIIFYPALFALCKKFFSNSHDILTALNNGMLKVYSNIDQFDNSKGDFSGWVYTVVKNSALTMIRDRKSTIEIDFFESMEKFDDLIITDESDLTEVYKLLDVLPDTTRVVCSLFYLENYSIKEIATNLDIKEGTVKWHLHASREKIKSVSNNKYVL